MGALLGLGSAASKVTPTKIEPDGSHIIGTYADDLGRVSGLVIGDLAFAASSGAALAMMPATAARDAVKDGEPRRDLLENYREVCNVTTSMLNSRDTPPPGPAGRVAVGPSRPAL
jgi:hypothetical protein